MDFSEWKQRFNPPGLTGRDLRNTQKYGFAGRRIFRPVDDYAYENLLYHADQPEDAVWELMKYKTKTACAGAVRLMISAGAVNALGVDLFGPKTRIWRVRCTWPVQGDAPKTYSVWVQTAAKGESWRKLKDYGTDPAAMMFDLVAAVADPLIIEGWHDEDFNPLPLPEVTEAGPAEAGTPNKLPLNTCVKWPYRACGGGCEEKACCTCKSDDCNSRQTCASPGEQPHHDHQDGWPTPPDEPAAVMLMPAETATAPAPASLENCTAEIRDLIQTGRHAAVRISILIAQAHASYFKESPKDWLKWAESNFNYKRRFCFTLLKAGKLLVQQNALNPEQRLLMESTDISKLEVMAEIPQHLLPVFLKKHPNLSAMSRKDIDTLANCYAQGKTVKELETIEEQIAEAKLQKKTAKADKTLAAQKALQVLVSLMADQQAMVTAAKDLDPMAAIQAGFCALQLALNRLECSNAALNADQFRVTGHLLIQFEKELSKYKPQES